MNPDNAKDAYNILCGGSMQKMKDGQHWCWVCMQRVNGVKCNKSKMSIRSGTIFWNSQLSPFEIMLII